MDENSMAWWHDLSWGVRQRTVDEAGNVTKGRIERLDKLAFDYELERAVVKKKAVAEISRDVYGNVITKGKGKKAKVKTAKQEYVKAELKTQNATFQTTYQAATGTTDILGKVEEIREMIGYTAPLVLGREYVSTDPETGEAVVASWPRIWGLFEMQLTRVKVSDTEMDELGRLTKATVQFTLTQTPEREVTKASFQNMSEGVKELVKSWLANPDSLPDAYLSALSVCPDPNVKAMVKAKKKQKKEAEKAAKKALKEEVKAMNRQIRSGG